jgi:hypothetical protein
MPSAASDGPSVSLSFANNFWGKDDAGVEPLLSRMHSAKQTCDEVKGFYQGMSLYRGSPGLLTDLQPGLQSKMNTLASFSH